MTARQYILPLAHELVVDLFAGGGGASTGIERALGRHVDIAVNHDPEAVSLHQANHPQTEHHVSNVWEVDPRVVCAGRPIGLLWASPDCTYHSKARGGKPHRDRNKARRRRGLAGIVVKWVRQLQPTGQHPRVICLENVEEFQHWGPLLEDGTPCPQRRGSTFQRWVAQLANLGYAVEWRELRACDFGTPTIRKRLFLVARRDGRPIVWPQPTHADPKHARAKGLQPWRTAADCIDWSLPCPSIFERERPLADATLRRIAHGVMRYVVNAAKPYIVRIGHTGHGDGGKVRAADQPLSTITSKAEHCLVAAFLAKHYTGVVGSDLAAPLGTVTTVDHHSLVQAFLTAYYGSDQDTPLHDPLHTVTTKPRFALVTVNGVPHEITDIGMRMLQPRELYRAQGFPDAYQIERGADGRTLSKAAQVRMCGNSVCPPLAQALVRVNYAEQANQQERKAA